MSYLESNPSNPGIQSIESWNPIHRILESTTTLYSNDRFLRVTGGELKLKLELDLRQSTVQVLELEYKNPRCANEHLEHWTKKNQPDICKTHGFSGRIWTKIFTLWFGGGQQNTHTGGFFVEAIPSAESLIATLIESAGRPESLDSATRSRQSDARWWPVFIRVFGRKKIWWYGTGYVNLSWFIRQRVRRTHASPRRVCMVSFFFWASWKFIQDLRLLLNQGPTFPEHANGLRLFFRSTGFRPET